jgi:hypothetical protein
MAALERRGLIRHCRRRRSSNVYSFLWHDIFEVQQTALQQSNLEVQGSPFEVQDDVCLKVHSAAQESSPLESRPLNSVKADVKRIPGYASHKQRSSASASATQAHEDSKNETLKGDLAPRAVGNPTTGWKQSELAEVRGRIVALLGREPEEGFEISVMLRGRGASALAVCELFDRKFANKNFRKGGRWAPRSQNWFLTVIENEFTPGHLPELPAMPLPGHSVEAEAMTRGIEAIELPHADRSIAQSVICSECGSSALVLYTDGSVDGCGCRAKRDRGLNRIPASSSPGMRSSPTTAQHR